VLENIQTIGQATGTGEKAESVVSRMQARIDAVLERTSRAVERPQVLTLEWVEPLMCTGHWVPEMVEMAGGSNCLGGKEIGAFHISWDKVVLSEPEIIILMPCGYDVKRALQDVPLLVEKEGWADLPAVRNNRVYVVDASAYTSRAGPRLVTALEIMAEMIHPSLFSGMVPEGGGVRLFGNMVKS
jgi:iron complex transport system substrate-binding protein